MTVEGVSGATAIAVGPGYTCALVSGSVKCWGLGYTTVLSVESGQKNYLPGPVTVAGVSGATAIAARFLHTCALVNGGVKCWQVNSGELGAGGAMTDNAPMTLVDVAGVSGATAIVASEGHTCALVSGGVKCWGSNDLGQLGDGTASTDNDPSTPVDVVGVSGATAITAGARHTCALVGGSVKCWGDLDPSQSGNGAPDPYPGPFTLVSVAGIDDATAIAAGSAHTCALVNGSVKCWGENRSGQLGDGSNVVAPHANGCGGGERRHSHRCRRR